MSLAVRRGVRPVGRTAPAAVCLGLAVATLVGCTSGSTTEPTQPDRGRWAATTVAMLRDGLHVGADGTILVLPSAQAGDAYTAALALIGAADKASAVLQAAGADAVRQRFRDAVRPADLTKSVAGPVSAAATILRADRAAALLDEGSRASLRSVLDAGLAAPATDVYVAADAVDLATMLDYRAPDARRRLAALLAQTPLSCVGTEGLYAVGATIGRTDGGGCAEAQLGNLIQTEMARLDSSVGATSHPGLGEAEALLALARIEAVRAEPERISQLRQVLESLDRAIAERRLGDITPAAADLATTATLLGVARPVPAAVVDHLTVVVRGNGEAMQIRLDPDGLAMAIRTRRALGDAATSPDLPGVTPQGALELKLATLSLSQAPEPATAAQVHDLAARVDLSTPSGALVALRAANLLGKGGCDLGPLVELATSLVQRPRGTVAAEDVRRALSWRLLHNCGAAPAEAAREAVLAPAKAVLAAAKPGPSRPSVIEASQAAIVACALDPAALSEVDSWRAFGDDALPQGGVADPQGAFVDLEATFDLAVLTATDRSSCSHVGLLG